MIKVSVLYPAITNAKFDHEYYKSTHMPLVKKRLGFGCRSYTIDKGISSGEPNSAPPYVAMCHIFSDSIEDFEAAMVLNGPEIFADIPNFTDLTPIVQISEVVVG